MDQDQKPNTLPNGQSSSGSPPDRAERLRKITQLGTDFVTMLIEEVHSDFDKNRKNQSYLKSWCHQKCETVSGRVKELEGTIKELQKQVAVKIDEIESLEAKLEQIMQAKVTDPGPPSGTQTKSTQLSQDRVKEEKLEKSDSGRQLHQDSTARSNVTSGQQKTPIKHASLSSIPALHPFPAPDTFAAKPRGEQRPSSALGALLNKIPKIPEHFRTSWDIRTEAAAATAQNQTCFWDENRKRKTSDGGPSDLLHPDLPKRKRPTFGQREEMINCIQAKIDAGHSEGTALMSTFGDPKFKHWGDKTIQGAWLERDDVRQLLKTKPYLKDKKNNKRMTETTSRSESEDDGGQLGLGQIPQAFPWMTDYFQFYQSRNQ